MPFEYLDSFNDIAMEKEPVDNILKTNLEEPDNFRLNDLHTNTGCITHANTGCNTHTNTGYDDYSDYSQSSCSNSGYDNFSQSYYTQCSQYTQCSHSYSDSLSCTHTGYSNYNNSGYDQYVNSYSGGICTDYCNDTHTNTGCTTYSNYEQCSESYSNYEQTTGYSQSSCSNSGYNDHSQSYYSQCGNTGCETHVNSGYDDHSNVGYTDHVNYTDNYDPVFGASIISGDGSTSYNQSIPLTWGAATDQLAVGEVADTVTYYLYYKYKPSGGSVYGSWQVPEIVSTTSTSYTVNCSSWSAGDYIIRCKAWDGNEWNDNGGTTLPANMTSATINTSGIDTAELSVVHYQAPSWTNPILTGEYIYKTDVEQLQVEINNARSAYYMTGASFPALTIEPIPTDALNLRGPVNEVYQEAGNPAFAFTDSTISTSDAIDYHHFKEIRDILDSF